MKAVGAALACVLFVALIVGANAGCRNYRIDQCKQAGGVPVVPPWFSNDPIGVSCIKP